jgi:hypothetical protein
MLKKMHDMPAGTLGFEAVGEVDEDDVDDVLARPRLTSCLLGVHPVPGLRRGDPPGVIWRRCGE